MSGIAILGLNGSGKSTLAHARGLRKTGRAFLRGRDEVEQSLQGLSCPILRLDGARAVEENIQSIRRFLYERNL